MKRRFEFSEGSSNKFWEIEVKKASLTTTFGKIGTAGQRSTKSFGSEEETRRQAEKLVAEKVKKGYQEVGGAKAKPAKGSKPGTGPKATKAPDASAMVAALEKLDTDLKSYAPKRHAAIRPATNFSKLEALVPIPAPVRALWRWADGGSSCEELLITGAEPWEAMLSVNEAVRSVKMLRATANFPSTLVPLATDGGGNFLVVDPSGVVFDWDHETRKTRRLAPSLVALIERALKGIKNATLFGGPGPGAAVADPTMGRIAKLMKSLPKGPERDLQKIVELSVRLSDEAAVEVLLHPDLKAVAEKLQRHERDGWSLVASKLCARVSRWDDLLFIGRLEASVVWSELGDHAWASGAREVALQCFEFGTTWELRGEDGIRECQVGAAFAANALKHRSAKKHVTACEKEFKEEFGQLSKELAQVRAWGPEEALKHNYQPVHIERMEQKFANLLLLRAIVATLKGDRALAKRLISEREAQCSKKARERLDRIPTIVDASGVLARA